jgi:radical SAM superfamily enzyme YgiQ (UPF0313 family)
VKVLIVSSNALPASPSGPAYVAGAVRAAGHEVRVYETLFADDLATDLASMIEETQPDVVGISIRLVFGDVLDPDAYLGTRHIDLRPRVKETVRAIRAASDAPIVLGGPGFNYYARDWLDYLDVDYGIRGEAERSFPLFLERLACGGDIYSVPGAAFRKGGRFDSVPPDRVEDWDLIAGPAYDLFDLEEYAKRGIGPAIFTKRGCVFRCTFCPYGKLEGKRYRLKSPERVVAEIRHIQACGAGDRVMFCDNSFNVPRHHAEAICREMLSEGLDVQWATGDLKPIGVTPELLHLLEDSGCYYVNLAVESASDTMLRGLQRGYRAAQVRESLEALSASNVPWGASLMFGGPGETPETIDETLRVLDDYEIPQGVWVTLGVYMWTDYQDIVADARRAGSLGDEADLFSGMVYLSPDLPARYLAELPAMLRARKGYMVQFNKPDEQWTLRGRGDEQGSGGGYPAGA